MVYLSHLNGSPKRISSREPDHYGATLAVPVFVNNIMQVMVLIYDQNPLVFKDAVKHKLLNFVRLASHMIAINWSHHKEYDLLRTDDRHIFRMDVWQHIAERYLESITRSEVRLGIGRLNLTNSHNLRAKLRLEQLNEVEQQIIERSRPVNMGLPGFLGHIQEFTYAVILPITQDETISYYERCLMERKNKPFKLHTSEAVNAELEVSFTVVSGEAEELNWQRTVDSLR